MSVKNRLRRLTGENDETCGQISQKEIISVLRKKIDAVMSRRGTSITPTSYNYRQDSVRALEDLVVGEEVENRYGRFFLSRTFMPGGSSHGKNMIGDLSCIDMDRVSMITGNSMFGSLRYADGLFIDTETTGLAGGSGTFAFLIGLGWFDGDNFVITQLFARDFSEEAAVLAYIQDIAKGRSFLVSFNGRAYDINLLSARYILNRMEAPFLEMPHLDLLHPCRRLIGHRLDNCRLVTLEAEILGFRRVGDVPGYEIPQRYFDWLRYRDGFLMEDVFEHNRYDIVSMAALVRYITGLLYTGDADHRDLLAAAGLLSERGAAEYALKVFETLSSSHDKGVAMVAKKSLSLMHKRSARWDDALRVWQDMLKEYPNDSFAVIEAAKYLEHRARDYERAFNLVDGYLFRNRGKYHPDTDALVHRLNRLNRKRGG